MMPSGTLNERDRPIQYSIISESADFPVEERPVIMLSPFNEMQIPALAIITVNVNGPDFHGQTPKIA